MAPTPTQWPAPTPPPASRNVAPTGENVAPTEETDVAADDEADIVHDADEDRPSRRRRHRRATENFAEALARAEDPTRPELPGAAETAAALAALRADGSADGRGSDSSLPRELPAADEIPMADEADQQTTPGEVAEAEPPVDPEVQAPTTGTDEPATAAASEPEPGPEPSQPADGDGEVSDATEGVEDDGPVEPEPEPKPEPEPDRSASMPEDAAMNWDPQRYSVDIEEPDWYVEEEPSPAATAAEEPDPTSEPDPPDSEADDASPERSPEPATEPTATILSASEAGEAAFRSSNGSPSSSAPPADATDPGTGADEMEVVGSQPPAPPTSPILRGSPELDEAMAALDALAGRSRSVEPTGGIPVDPPARTGDGTPDPSWPAADRPSTRSTSVQPGPRTSGRPGEHPRLATTPASRAYRRLRRIFPG